MKKAHVILALTFLFILSACQLGAPAPTATPLPPTETFTPEPSATITPSPTITPEPSATPNLVATQQVADMMSIVEEQLSQRHISSTEGEYFVLPDFQDQYAHLTYYKRFPIGVKARDFIFRADFEWESDIQFPNLAGCGITYHGRKSGDHKFVSVTNNTILMGISDEVLVNRQNAFIAKYGKPDYFDNNYIFVDNTKIYLSKADNRERSNLHLTNPAKVNVIIVVNGTSIYVYVNNEFEGRFQLLPPGEEGSLDYAILSGSNSGYGTYCSITNAQLWKIKP